MRLRAATIYRGLALGIEQCSHTCFLVPALLRLPIKGTPRFGLIHDAEQRTHAARLAGGTSECPKAVARPRHKTARNPVLSPGSKPWAQTMRRKEVPASSLCTLQPYGHADTQKSKLPDMQVTIVQAALDIDQ